MKAHNICILLVNYNSLGDTLDCIESIQKAESDAFTVVIENGSNDKAVIADALNGISDVKLIVSQGNLGFGRANNLGIEWIKKNLSCKYIFLLNNDTVIEENTLVVLQDYMDHSPANVAMCAPKIYIYANPDEIWYAGGTFNYAKMTPVVNQDPLTTRSATLFASGCCMFFKSDDLYKLGGFDPFFFMYDEDVELSLRIGELGKTITYVPEAVVYHKCQGSQTKQLNIPSNQLHPNHPSLIFYLKNTILNRRYIIHRYLKGMDRIKTEVKYAVYWLMKAIQYVLYGKFKAAVIVIKYLFITPPSLMK